MPVDILKGVDPSLVSHIAPGTITVRVLVDATFTHPGPFLATHNRREVEAALRDVDVIGDAAVKAKREKYLAAANAAGFVLLPYHCSVYGRLHPIASKFLDAIVRLVVLKQRSGAGIGVSNLVDDTTSFKRALLRGLSIHMRRATVNGLWHAVCAASPRPVRAAPTSGPPGLVGVDVGGLFESSNDVTSLDARSLRLEMSETPLV